MKHIIPSTICVFLAIYFGYQGPRAATQDGTVLMFALSAVCMIAAVLFIHRYEQQRIPQLPKPMNMYTVSGHGWPTQDGDYAVRYKSTNGSEHTGIVAYMDGKFVTMKHYQIIAWAGPINNAQQS